MIPDNFKTYRVVNYKTMQGNKGPTIAALIQDAVDEYDGGRVERLYEDAIQAWVVHSIEEQYADIIAAKITKTNATRKKIQQERKELQGDHSISNAQYTKDNQASKDSEVALMVGLDEFIGDITAKNDVTEVRKFVGRWLVFAEETQGTVLVSSVDGEAMEADFHPWPYVGFTDFYDRDYLKTKPQLKRAVLVVAQNREAGL